MNKALTKALLLICVITMATLLIGTGSLLAKDKPINLMFGTFDASKGPFSKVMMDFAKEVEERTGGRVKVKINWMMGKPGDLYDLAKKGIVDIGWDSQVFHPGLFPLTEVFELPFVVPTSEIGTRAMNEYLKQGYVDKAYKDGVKFLWAFVSDAHNILLTKKTITRVDDFKGMKIGVGGSTQAKFVAMVGGAPVGMPMPEMYSSLQKGIIDGTIFGFPMLVQFRLFEVGKYVMGPPMISGYAMCVMNEAKWNSLPADIQGIIDELTFKYSIGSARAWDGFSKMGQKMFLDAGGQMNTLDQEELNKLSKRVEPLWAEWIHEMTKKGLPAEKAVDSVYNSLKKLGVENPAVGYKPGG